MREKQNPLKNVIAPPSGKGSKTSTTESKMASSVTSETFDTEEDKTTDEDKTTEDILEETARDFAGYVLVDPQREVFN